jgi:hypothetical protein
MKNFIILLTVAAFAQGLAQNGATIEYKISSSRGASGTIQVNQSEFGSVSQFDMQIPQMPGGGISMKSLLRKQEPDVIYQINDRDKTYSKSNKSEAAGEDNKTYKAKKIGDETVAGYKCVHAIVDDGKESYEVWSTKDIPGFEKYAEAMRANKKTGSVKREQALKEAGCDGLPVKTLHKGNEREGDMTMELQKLEKKNFNSADFEVPAGYNMTSQRNPVMPQVKSQQELINMSPEERAKYVEEMKRKYGK